MAFSEVTTLAIYNERQCYKTCVTARYYSTTELVLVLQDEDVFTLTVSCLIYNSCSKNLAQNTYRELCTN